MKKLLAVAAAVVSPVAFAADAVDVSGLVTTISGTLAPIGLVGLAVLGVVAGTKVFKYIRSAM